MWSFPFISRRAHDAIVAEKSEHIQSLKEQVELIRYMEERGHAQHAALEDKLVDALKARMLPEPLRRRRPDDEESKAPETLDLAQVDPNDNEALILIAKRELPQGTRVSASAVLRTVEKLRGQVIEAHAARLRSHSTPVYVPQATAERIAAATQAGISAAAQEVGV